MPVVFISSHGQFASTARVLGAGFLLKPFLKGELLDAVASRSRARGMVELSDPLTNPTYAVRYRTEVVRKRR